MPLTATPWVLVTSAPEPTVSRPCDRRHLQRWPSGGGHHSRARSWAFQPFVLRPTTLVCRTLSAKAALLQRYISSCWPFLLRGVGFFFPALFSRPPLLGASNFPPVQRQCSAAFSASAVAVLARLLLSRRSLPHTAQASSLQCSCRSRAVSCRSLFPLPRRAAWVATAPRRRPRPRFLGITLPSSRYEHRRRPRVAPWCRGSACPVQLGHHPTRHRRWWPSLGAAGPHRLAASEGVVHRCQRGAERPRRMPRQRGERRRLGGSRHQRSGRHRRSG